MTGHRAPIAICLIPLIACSATFVLFPSQQCRAQLMAATSTCRQALTGVRRVVSSQAIPKRNTNAEMLSTAAQVCHTSQSLPNSESYHLLKSWVMPDGDPATWRLAVFRLPSDELAEPIPPTVRALKTIRMAHGTTLASPAFELIESADRAGQLTDLQKLVDARQPSDELGRRNQIALQILVAMAAKNDDLAKSKVRDQLVLVKSIAAASFTTRDPEHLIIIGLLDQAPWLDAAKSLGILMWEKYEGNYRQVTLQSERSLIDTIDKKIAQLPCLSDAQRLPHSKAGQWQQGVMETARSRELGTNSATWSVNRGLARLSCGETPSQLFFQSPLIGDFEVTCDMSTSPFREGSIAYGMLGVCPYWDLRGTFVLPVLGQSNSLVERLELPRWDSSADVRIVVNDGQMVNYVNGVKIHSTPLKAAPDPWLAIHTFNPWYSTSVRNLRITGNPRVPAEVELSSVTDLVNWRADYFGERVGPESDPAAQWFQRNDEILSRVPVRRGTKSPGLLLHQRPLSFDGELTYEFFYEPGKSEVHPTLGQIVWLLAPKEFQQRRLAEFSPSRGPASGRPDAPFKALPEGLVPNDWNRVRLSLMGATAVLTVNEKKIDELAIDETNTRQFGLFRNSDVSGSRIRAVKWRGDWPRKLPGIDDQDLAIPAAGLFAGKLWPTKGTLKLNASMDALRKLTLWTNVSDEFYTETPEGIELSLDSTRRGSGVTELAWPHHLRGDFDITVSVGPIRLESKNAPEVSLRVVFDDEIGSGLAIIVGANPQGRKQIMADHIRRPADDSYWFERWERHVELNSGRLRIAREGGRAWLFYSENDDEYRLLTTYSVGNADVKGVTLWTQIHGPDGNLRAVYRELTIKTDEIVD